jgi:hypothetical protein
VAGRIRGIEDIGHQRARGVERPAAIGVVVADWGLPTSPLGGARGAVRFSQQLRPTAESWQQYRAGTQTWSALVWPQDLRGYGAGMRMVAIGIELQLMPGESAQRDDPSGQQAVPFLGSASLQYAVKP